MYGNLSALEQIGDGQVGPWRWGVGPGSVIPQAARSYPVDNLEIENFYNVDSRATGSLSARK